MTSVILAHTYFPTIPSCLDMFRLNNETTKWTFEVICQVSETKKGESALFTPPMEYENGERNVGCNPNCCWRQECGVSDRDLGHSSPGSSVSPSPTFEWLISTIWFSWPSSSAAFTELAYYVKQDKFPSSTSEISFSWDIVQGSFPFDM